MHASITVLLILLGDSVPTISCMGAIRSYHWTLFWSQEGFDNQREYVSVLRARLKDAYEAATTAIQEAGKSTKQQYDSSSRGLMRR